MQERIIYRGSRQTVEHPEIRAAKYGEDFACGFYRTLLKEQAVGRAMRYPVTGCVNEFVHNGNPGPRVERFEVATEERPDFTAACRNGGEHDLDIVEGLVANDTVFNHAQDFVYKKISLEAFRALTKFKKPARRISFHTRAALPAPAFKGHEIHEN